MAGRGTCDLLTASRVTLAFAQDHSFTATLTVMPSSVSSVYRTNYTEPVPGSLAVISTSDTAQFAHDTLTLRLTGLFCGSDTFAAVEVR